MNSSSATHYTDLIPVSEATSLVPYSRDHITRLAREGKIIATQIARRWMVSAVSLQRFYESCRHEDMVRQQYLSEARRRDLEIAEQLRLEHAEIAAAVAVGTPSSWYSATVVLSGLLCGVILHASMATWLMDSIPATPTAAAPVTDAVVTNTQLASVGSAMAVSSDGNENDRVATSQTRALALDNGIVLLPMVASSTLRSEDFFSDEVEIEMIDSTEGIVRLSNSPDAPALTVVRIPGASETAVTPRAP